jgi:hypothetical protein
MTYLFVTYLCTKLLISFFPLTSLQTYQPTYLPTYLSIYLPTNLLHMTYLPTYQFTYLLNYLPPSHVPFYKLTYLTTSYFPPTILHTYLPTSYLLIHLLTYMFILDLPNFLTLLPLTSYNLTTYLSISYGLQATYLPTPYTNQLLCNLPINFLVTYITNNVK